MNRFFACILTLGLGVSHGLFASEQAAVRGGIFIEAEDYDRRDPGQENFAAVALDPAASDGCSVYRFHKGTVRYRFRVKRAGRYRFWLRYGAPGDAWMRVGVDPPDLKRLDNVPMPATGGCVGPGVWRWRLIAEASLKSGEHVLALGSGALRPDCIFITVRPDVRPDDAMLKEVTWPPGPRLPELMHDRSIARHPTWLHDLKRVCYAHCEWNPGVTVEAWCRRAAAAGAQAIVGAGELPAGMMKGKMQPLPAAPVPRLPEGYRIDYSWVKRYARAAHAAGLRFLCYVNADRTLDPLLVDHPEWRQQTLLGRPFRGWGSWCSPYKAAFIQRLERIARESEFDGIMIDMPFVGPPGGDYSPYTVAAFKKRFGVDPPRRPRPRDPLFQRWIDFQCFIREQWLLELTEALHQVNPECAVIANQTRGWIFDISRRGFLSTRVGRCVDGLLEEEGWEIQQNWRRPWAWPLQSAWQNLFLHCRTWPGIGMMWHVTYNMPEIEAECQAFAMLANGTAPAVTTGGNWPVMEKIWAHIKACQPWTDGAKLRPWAAILFSEQTLAHYANVRGEAATSDYMEGVFGFFQAALERHLPIAIITDDDVADPARLRRYAVLLLPNSACLSEQQAQALAAYVQAGGGLVATFETGCYDEFGVHRAKPALAKVFGVRQGTADSGVAFSMPLRNLSHPILDDPRVRNSGYWGQGRIEPAKSARLYIGPSTRKVGAVQTQVVAKDLFSVPMSGSRRLRHAPLEPKKNWAYFLLHARSFGRGRVAYFPLALGHAYFCYTHPLDRALIERSMRWAASRPCPLETNAPLCVETVLYRRGRAWLVHLLNDLSSFGRAAAPNPEAFGGFRTEVLPVHGIELSIPGRFEKATLFPAGTPLNVHHDSGRTRVTVPVLRIHALVVFE